MSRGDEPDYKAQAERDRIKTSNLSQRDKDTILEFLDAFDPGVQSVSYQNDKGETETLSYNSIEQYGRGLRLTAKESDCDLLDHALESLGAIFEDWLDGLAKQTVRQRQAGAIKYYRYHDAPIDPDGITLTDVDDTSVDERDMFSKADIERLRDACNNARDRCLLELLIYTGQRIRALQTLRLQDIDLDNGIYYLNTDELGLKGAGEHGTKRPLLGAEKAVRDWMNKHTTSEPDDNLLCPLPSATNTQGDPGEYLSLPALRRQLYAMGDRGDVDKPVNPHNFRHYFVTVCYREYDMDPSTIKYLIGHGQDSTVMETTYQHLTDEDFINQARAATSAGKEPDQEDKGTLTPDTCPVCAEPLAPDDKACSDCGYVFTPDAHQSQQQIQQEMEDGVVEVENEREAKIVRTMLQDLRENPDEYV